MKSKIIVIAFLFLNLIVSNYSYSQEYKKIDSIVKKYPRNFSSPEALATRIQKDFKTEYSKARAIYDWIAMNIKYDVQAILNPKPSKGITYRTDEEFEKKMNKLYKKKLAKTLRKKKAICGDYSELYHRVATLVGLNSEVIAGDSKNSIYGIGKKRTKTSHAWNSVQIDGVWRLIDVTWGAGYVIKDTDKFVKSFSSIYFDTPSKIFFLNHYPKSGVWQGEVVDKNEFLKSPLIYNSFLEGNYKIIEPQNGVIEVQKNQKIRFKILNLSDKSNLYYSLKKQDETEKIINKTIKDNVLEFEITIDKTIGRFLTIYEDNFGIVTFKIIIKP